MCYNVSEKRYDNTLCYRCDVRGATASGRVMGSLATWAGGAGLGGSGAPAAAWRDLLRVFVLAVCLVRPLLG